MFIGSTTTVISPCISQCKLDEDDNCLGCYRSAAEISDWMRKSEDEQIAISIRCKKEIARREQNS
ncbi:DUF1289 domain-containing protein [Colwellia sp. E2M01]|uniref:DUF1289 domain-containing protein n=1 Tax=Colwellia sp. E2M01 TaxID=2841561 RepID=UPI001C09E37A|nr:DUF1289 domain-containing protein [Colwellia sp. E2M01]MBU2870898.1 DUF1289 domain-containing protein [Colwellia sp. E2M01]